MKRRASFYFVAAALSFGAIALLFGNSPRSRIAAQPGTPTSSGAKTPTDPKAEAAKAAVMANIKEFTRAYNQRDVATLLKLFTSDCELNEADGTTIRGLKELEEGLKDSFDDEPEARISVSVESLRLLSPDVIIEEGKTEFYPDGKTLTAETDYHATHVKKGDRWLMSHVRSFNRVILSPYDQLRQLEWLIGDWVDESPDSVVETSYRWDANKAFLLQDFTVRVEGQTALTGTQRIGRDPLTKQIKAWVFDSGGGYSENLWTPVDDTWVIKGTGVRADGKVVTMTNQITQLGKDRMKFESIDRIVGDERFPGFTAITVRKPPQPAE
jgi:uncharacterized protein (TIGR02246 family)